MKKSYILTLKYTIKQIVIFGIRVTDTKCKKFERLDTPPQEKFSAY